MKTGRNQACPCGSDEKYKKCCLSKDEATRDAQRKQQRLADLARADIRATAQSLAEKRQHLDELETSDTPTLVSTLANHGIALSEEKLSAYAQTYYSAHALSKSFLKSTKLGGYEEDEVYVICLELWKRWPPETPCIEMLADWVRDADEALWQSGSKDYHKICAPLLEAWKGTVKLCKHHRIHTVEKLENLFETCDIYIQWIDDLVTELGNRGIKEPEYANQGIEIVAEALALFSESPTDDPTLEALRNDALRLYFLAEREEEGIKHCQAKIERDPHLTVGYTQLADGLLLNPSQHSPAERKDRLEKSIRILESAKAYPVVDGPDYDLDLRLEDLRRELQKRVDETNPEANPSYPHG